MATTRRTKSPTITEQLFEEGYRFEFYQAVKLIEKLIQTPVPENLAVEDELYKTLKRLEKLSATTTPVADSTDPHKEALQFRSKISNAFPASDVEAIQPPTEEGQPITMDVNFMGLAGAHGPLPPPYTDLILERMWRGDTASRDFLDIFNHRLISLLYRARQQQRIGLEVQQPWESQFAQHLFALLGFGTPGLQQRMQLDEHVLLFYTGLFAQESRSLSTLEKMLSHFFQVTITAEPFIGQWLNIAEDDYTRIGVSGQNQRLGQTVALGTRVWDLHSQFALHIGPLNFKTFIDFLPIGLGFMPLCEMTRLFVGPELDFEINLSLKAAEIPETRLSSTGQARLGWTSGLKTQPCEHDSHLKLSSKLFYDRQKKSAIPIFASLQPYELERVLNQMTSHTYPMHTKVLKQGEVGDSLLIIRHGEVQVRYQGLDGQQHLLAILGEGQFFGEMSFLTRSSRTVTVITITACQILELSQPHLAQIIEQYPQVKKTLEVYYQQRVVQWRMR